MKNLSIKILFACVFTCVCVLNASAGCPTTEKDVENLFKINKKNDEKKFDEALKMGDKAVEKHPTCFMSFWIRGTTFYYLNKFDEAISDFKKADELMKQETQADWKQRINTDLGKQFNDEFIGLLSILADNAAQKNDFQSCVDRLTLALNYRVAPKLLIARGNCRFGLNDVSGAVEDVSAAAEDYVAGKKFDEAISTLSTFLQKIPDNEQLLLSRCKAYGAADKLQLAYEDCEKAVQGRKELNDDAMANLAFYAEKLHRYGRAAAVYSTVADRAKDNPQVDLAAIYETLGRYQYLNGRLDKAAAAFEKAQQSAEDNRKDLALWILILNHEKSGFKRILDTDLTEEVIKADGKKLDAVGTKMDNGKTIEAFEDVSEILKRRPHYADALFNRGYINLKTNQIDKAIADFDLAAKLEPWSDVYHYYLAEAYTDRDPNKCVEAATNAINIRGDFNRQAFVRRGFCGKDSAIQAHSDYLNAKWLDNSSPKTSVMDIALGYYGEKKGCGTIKNGTFAAYFNRGVSFMNEKRDYLCAVSDFAVAADLTTNEKGETYYGRGAAYYNLVVDLDVQKLGDKSLFAGVTYPFLLQSSMDFAHAIRDGGGMNAVKISDAYHRIGVIFNKIGEEYTPSKDGRIKLFEMAIDNLDKAIPNANESAKVKTVADDFITRVQFAIFLMNEIQAGKAKQQTERVKTLTEKLAALAQKIESQRKEFSSNAEITKATDQAYQVFQNGYTKFGK